MNGESGESNLETGDGDGSHVVEGWRAWVLLRPRDQVVGATLLVVLLMLMIVKWGQLSGWAATSVEITDLPAVENGFRLDMNSATAIEWSQLDGIGEVLAARIVEDRETNGPFESIDDLQRVEGIGRQTLEQIRPWLITTQNQKNQTKPARTN